MTLGRLLLGLALLGLLAAGAAAAWALRHPAIAPIAPPDPASFDPALVARGAALAGIGNCAVCHTRPGGPRYAGGLALPTPFGTIHVTNITPDPETGIGTWSEAAFIRAMREGIDREGRHLYPAFPYDYYTRVTDEDLRAIYAYLMTREPVHAPALPNGLAFPFNIRLLMEGWNTLFHRPGPFVPDPARDAEWNRGAYLVEGLGHCGACHSPRNRFGAPARTGEPGAYGGGWAEGWYAPPLTAAAEGPVPWTQLALVNYLIDGWDENHGLAAGPMIPVVNDLYDQDEDDVFAIAAYLMHLKGGEPDPAAHEAGVRRIRAAAERLEWGHPEAPPTPSDPALAAGAELFRSQCAECHRQGGKPVPLALTPTVHAPDPDNLIQVILWGIQPPPRGAPDRGMPGRHIQIADDAALADLVAFVRDRYTDRPAWADVPARVRAIRAAGPPGH